MLLGGQNLLMLHGIAQSFIAAHAHATWPNDKRIFTGESKIAAQWELWYEMQTKLKCVYQASVKESKQKH